MTPTCLSAAVVVATSGAKLSVSKGMVRPNIDGISRWLSKDLQSALKDQFYTLFANVLSAAVAVPASRAKVFH